MSYDDATVPMQSPPDYPTWPAQPPTPSRSSRSSRSARPSPPSRPASSGLRGCGVALAIAGAFIAGMVISTLLGAVLFAQAPNPATSSSASGGALKVTITDAFLNEALNASSASGSLSNIQTHIQENGQLTISGTLQRTIIASGQTAVIVLAPSVSQGKLTVKIVSGSVGGFPLPGLALNPIVSSINQQLVKASRLSIGGGQHLTISGISFASGEMTLVYA